MRIRSTAGLRAKLLVLVGTLLLLVLLGIVGELVFRLFGDAQLMGMSRNLFTAKMYGESKGNTPNVEAIAYAEPVFTDGNGFRVSASYDARSDDGNPAVLVLGDSVAFGPGVAEERTLAGRLRESLTGQRVYNSAVIGYGAPNYRDVVDTWLPEHPEVHTVILVLCLNDVRPVSARKIDEALDAASKNQDQDHVQSIKRIRLVEAVNGFLRSRSKLYMTFRNVLTDPPRRYWEDIETVYQDPAAAAMALQPIREIEDSLTRRDIRFLVVISPFEYQVRTGARADTVDLPQRVIAAVLTEGGVEFLDALPHLRELGGGSRYFMVGDPVHYSEAGHQAIHDLLLRELTLN